VIPTPKQVSGLTLWLDATDVTGTGTTPAPGILTTWVDKSGNGYNGTNVGNGTLAASPARVTFDGSSYYTTAYTDTPTAETGFVVCSTTSSQGTLVEIGGGTTLTGYRILYLYSPDSSVTLGENAVANLSLKTGVVRDGTKFLTSYTLGNSSSQVFLNGTGGAVGSWAVANSGTTSIGGDVNHSTGNFIGAIYEVLIYNSSLSTENRKFIESYLKNKWGTP
jgi:hypothetical protein